jgi:hypothetical protein
MPCEMTRRLPVTRSASRPTMSSTIASREAGQMTARDVPASSASGYRPRPVFGLAFRAHFAPLLLVQRGPL